MEEEMRYIFSKMSVWGCFVAMIGAVFTLQGIIVRCNLMNIKDSYDKSEIRNGRYIECDISKEQLMGMYYTNVDGSIKYGPYWVDYGYFSRWIHIVSISGDSSYYVPLIVTKEFQKEFVKMINGDESYHVFGRFEKFDYALDYDTITKCTGIDSKAEIDRMVSSKYQIKVVDIKEEKKVLYKGLSILTVGLLLFLVTVKKEKADWTGETESAAGTKGDIDQWDGEE